MDNAALTETPADHDLGELNIETADRIADNSYSKLKKSDLQNRQETNNHPNQHDSKSENEFTVVTYHLLKLIIHNINLHC